MINTKDNRYVILSRPTRSSYKTFTFINKQTELENQESSLVVEINMNAVNNNKYTSNIIPEKSMLQALPVAHVHNFCVTTMAAQM